MVKYKRKERLAKLITMFLMNYGIWEAEKCHKRFKFKMRYNKMQRKLKNKNSNLNKRMKRKNKLKMKKKKNKTKAKIIFHKQNGIKE